jgi:hypothetical protein
VIVAAVNWTEWTAIGTLAAAAASVFLGLVTVWLVVTTKGIVSGNKDELAATNRLAEAAGDQARDAALALALQVEPRIVPVHESSPHFVPTDNIGGSVEVHWVNPLLLEVENVGAGVAQITRVEVTISQWGPPDGVVFPGVVRSGSKAVLRAEFTTPDGEIMAATVPPGSDVFARVHYRGAGDREFQIAFSWTRPAGSDARWQLTLLEATGHTELPVASS